MSLSGRGREAAGRGGGRQGAEETLDSEGGAIGFVEIGVEHRAVERDEVGFGEKRAMEGSDVAEADEDFGMGADGLVIESWKEAGGPVTAPDAEDPVDARVSEHCHDVGGAFAI